MGISGDASIIAVGDKGFDNDKGRATTYQWDDANDIWSEIRQLIIGSNEKDFLGGQLSLSADASIFITRVDQKAS